MKPDPGLDVESVVQQRYSVASQALEKSLCCPVDYQSQYLKVIPREVIERDYGCGDPSRHLRAGETVLDLGSGSGKICFIASQVVGPRGRVIGIDMNDDMLALARRHQRAVGEAIGWHNVEFRKGRIQDLALDLDRVGALLKERPVNDAPSLLALESLLRQLRREHPLMGACSVDVVISNCVLNLVDRDAKEQLFFEIFRVLREGGRAVISDIVSDESVPPEIQNDPQLWSGCIGGALTEERFVQSFERAGFHGIRLLERGETPWRVVEGIAFRSVTVEAFKGGHGAPGAAPIAAVYKGPFKEVIDDAGNRLRRGQRCLVSAATVTLYQNPPYQEFIALVEQAQATTRDAPVAEASSASESRESLAAWKPPLPFLTKPCCNGNESC